MISHPMMATATAASTPIQRKRQAPRSSSKTESSYVVMSSEPAFGHDEHVAGLQRQVLRHVPIVDERAEAHRDVLFRAADRADDPGAVARGVFREPTDGEHGIEHPHAVMVGDRLRRLHLTDHLDLTEETGRLSHDDVDVGRAHVFGKLHLYV